MRKPKKAPSARAERRARDRALERLAGDRERLARLEEGGTPERPIAVTSASQVEPHALGMPCPRCEGPERLEEHAAVSVAGESRRVARMRCARCGARRDVWFRLGPDLPS